MKRLIAIVLAFVMILGLVACGRDRELSDVNMDDKANEIKIVTTIFPIFDWVKEITKGNDNVDITMLLDNGVDLHSYEPTTADIVKVSDCDVFIYVGGESDGWVEDALKEATNKNMVVINLLDVLQDSIKEEEIVEGMEGEDEEEENEDEEEGPEYDEHVWLSVRCARNICLKIREELGKLDAKNKSLYEANAKEYINKLDELDASYVEAVKGASKNVVLFGDRFPFRYLVDDYGLTYYAAFVGCSAESEASFETITFLANKVDELSLQTILEIESSDGKIAETIKNATKEKNQQILTMDSMQSVTSEDVKKGATYLEIMKNNLSVLKEALGEK